MIKILKTMRLDLSDLNVFRSVAGPGEIAIPGSFAFVDMEYRKLTNKDKLAYQMSWLGVESFGFSTLVEIGYATSDVLDKAVERLAVHFVREYDAPSIAQALPVAREELSYAASLCEHDVGTILAIERQDGADGIVERIRPIDPSGLDMHQGLKIWDIVVEE